MIFQRVRSANMKVFFYVEIIAINVLLWNCAFGQSIESNNDGLQFNQSNEESQRVVWMVLAIVFISLFAVSVVLNIGMFFIRRRNLIQKQELDIIKRPSQTNVFYGGTKL